MAKNKRERYIDAMDHGRMVEPIKKGPREWLCRVYFRKEGFVGKAAIPASLFHQPEHVAERIGYLPLA